MSDKRKRRQSSGGWQDAASGGLSLEQAQTMGYGLRIDDMQQEDADALKGLVATSEGLIQYKNFELTPTGFVMPEDATSDSFDELGQILFRLEGAIQWLIGDWLAYSEAYQWGDIPALAEQFGREVNTLYDYKKVCSQLKFGVRTPNLSFSHHRLVMYLPSDEQIYWLTQAEANNWSVATLRAAIKADSQPEIPARTQSPLANIRHKQTFDRIFTALQNGSVIKTDDLDRLERWLIEVRHKAED